LASKAVTLSRGKPRRQKQLKSALASDSVVLSPSDHRNKRRGQARRRTHRGSPGDPDVCDEEPLTPQRRSGQRRNSSTKSHSARKHAVDPNLLLRALVPSPELADPKDGGSAPHRLFSRMSYEGQRTKRMRAEVAALTHLGA